MSSVLCGGAAFIQLTARPNRKGIPVTRPKA
ncbi:MAG: hypothetical protein QOJ76_563 [Acidobacteriota bacterium]|jgi:hypothetical protein|nr:hypothetical protein [Acidobacteriota bacterium]